MLMLLGRRLLVRSYQRCVAPPRRPIPRLLYHSTNDCARYFTTREANVVNEQSRGARFLQQQRDELDQLEGNLQTALDNYQAILLLAEEEAEEPTKAPTHLAESTTSVLIESLHQIRECYQALEYWDEALRIEEEIRKHITIIDHKTSSSDTKNDEWASSYYRTGILYHRQERWQLALRDYQKALDLHTNTISKGHVYISIAGVHFHRGDYHKALQTIQQDAEPCFCSFTQQMGLFKCYQHEGLIHRTLEDFPAALKSYQKAVAVLKTMQQHDEQLQQDVDLDTADMLAACDQWDEAMVLYLDLLKRTQQNDQDGNDSTSPLLFEAILLHNIGKIRAQQGDMDAAVNDLCRALQFKEHWLGEFHPELGKTLSALGAVYGVTMEKQKALECFQKALLIARMHADGEDDPDVFLALRNIAVLKGDVHSSDRTDE